MLVIYLKRFISSLFYPLTWCWLLLAVLVIGALCRRRRRTTALLLLPLSVLFIAGNRWFTTLLLSPLENAHAPLEESDGLRPAAVVVLGGGWFAPERSDVVTGCAQDIYWSRLAEGARAARIFPDARLIVSTASVDDSAARDRFFTNYAALFGIDVDRIEIIAGALDTGDEARQIRELVTDGPVILVTSAFHMRRASRRFTRAGLTVIPAPCGYLDEPLQIHWRQLFPNEYDLYRTRLAVKEYLGLLWEATRTGTD